LENISSFSVFLADDHELVAHGISTLLQKIEGVEAVKTFKNGKELFNACFIQKPDLIFLDYEMPVWDGKLTLENLKRDFPKIPVFMLSMLNEKSVIQACISIGAKGFLNKDCSFEELSDAFLSLKSDEIYYSLEIQNSLQGKSNKNVSNLNLKEEISEREMEILKLLCDGLSPKEIADKLFLSHRTVETHKNNIMQKFEVNSVAKLISIAIKNRIV
jgi:DNA-binding NarL/FixJ family response regulator